MSERYDAIIIGAGHNGLVCAGLLAKAGKRVLVLEENDQVGGASVTRSFADGYSVSSCAHLLYQLQPVVCKELGIDIDFAATDMETIALSQDGNHLRLAAGKVTGVSETDAREYGEFIQRTSRFADMLQKYYNRTPPRLANFSRSDLITLGKLGFDLRFGLGKEAMGEFMRLIGMNIYDEMQECFESPLLKGAISLDAVLGTHLGPRSPNTYLTFLHRMIGNHGNASQPVGGMGAVTAALANAATGNGAEIRTGAKVKQVVVENGRVTGVELDSGETADSWTVVSNADPYTTIMQLVHAKHFETGFIRRVSNIRAKGNAAKLHLALDGLPDFKGLDKKDFGERILIAGGIDDVERAFNPAKYGQCSTSPVMEISFPSFRDPSLAPTGKHVLSAIVQYVPYELRDGWNDAAREAFLKTTIDTIAKYAPDLPGRITASELLTPVDIEREYHMRGGHWHHAELTLDQFMFTRPAAGAAQYATPLEGLYLCGAGSHPGGGVMGSAGRNAARVILGQEKQV